MEKKLSFFIILGIILLPVCTAVAEITYQGQDGTNMDNAVVVDWPKFKLWIMENFEKFERKDSKYSNADVILVPMNQIPESVKIQDIGNMFKLDYDLARWEIEAIRGRKYRVEPAKSSRTVCVFCGESISKGHLRAGNQGGWRHIRCAVTEGILSRDSLVRLQEIDDLNDWQIKHIRSVLKYNVL